MPPNRKQDTIGASDVVAIVGLSEYSTPYDIALRITGKVSWEKYASGGVLLPVRGVTFYHPEYDWMACTPDGVNHEYPVSVDAKNIDYVKAKRFIDGLPEDFTVQGTWQNGVYNAWAKEKGLPLLDYTIFHVAIGNRVPKPFIVPYDDTLFKKLVIIVTNFRNQILSGDFSFSQEIITHNQVSPIKNYKKANKRQAQWLSKYCSINNKIEKLQDELSDVSHKIKMAIGDAYGLEDSQYRAAFAPYGGNVSYAEAMKEIVKIYKLPFDKIEQIKSKYKSNPSRRLRVYQAKGHEDE
jgi:hypothetical protein